MRTRRLVRGIAAGFAAGLAASAVMSGFQMAVQKIGSNLGNDGKNKPRGQKRRQSSQSDEPATYQAAHGVAAVFGHELREEEKHAAETAMHYAVGALSGAAYGAMAEMWDVTTAGRGALFGTAVWALADEVAVPALGYSKWADEYPLSTHAYALASHVVYGMATEALRPLFSGAIRQMQRRSRGYGLPSEVRYSDMERASEMGNAEFERSSEMR